MGGEKTDSEWKFSIVGGRATGDQKIKIQKQVWFVWLKLQVCCIRSKLVWIEFKGFVDMPDLWKHRLRPLRRSTRCFVRIFSYICILFLLLWLTFPFLSHFEETQHTFSLEVGGQRVWDYAGDNYVHRLIQSKSDGKMVQFESSTQNVSLLK